MGRITARSLDNLQVLIKSREHALLADEPKGEGDGLGMSPYDLLLAALGACTVMTLHMYARRKGWPLREVSISLEFRRDPIDEPQSSGSGEDYVEVIERDIDLMGELNEEQKQRLLYIAGRCPMAKTLTAPTKIVDTLSTSSG